MYMYMQLVRRRHDTRVLKFLQMFTDMETTNNDNESETDDEAAAHVQ